MQLLLVPLSSRTVFRLAHFAGSKFWWQQSLPSLLLQTAWSFIRKHFIPSSPRQSSHEGVERGCCYKTGRIFLTVEVATTQTVRHDIRKRVRMYGRYMLLFFDVTLGFVSSFWGGGVFRVYISCPQKCSVVNQHENTAVFTCGNGRYEMVLSHLTGSQTAVSWTPGKSQLPGGVLPEK
jgi:hypothetical protein